jgi:polyhydroxybutyrate depolymerase
MVSALRRARAALFFGLLGLIACASKPAASTGSGGGEGGSKATSTAAGPATGSAGGAGGAGGAMSTSSSGGGAAQTTVASTSAETNGSATSGTGMGVCQGGPVGGGRPVAVHVPPTYACGTPMPLVIMLHGLTNFDSAAFEAYFQIAPEADKRGFLYAHPDGTTNSKGQEFWNATDVCCDFDNTGVDDSTYLSDLITEIEQKYSVDEKRVYVFGHSNGGYMTYRMACDHADQIAAVASFAGAMWNDTSKCKPSAPMPVLQIHGTADATVSYTGGVAPENNNAYPGAVTTVGDWSKLDQCPPGVDKSHPPLDLASDLPGAETAVQISKNCAQGSEVQLWTINGGSHKPPLTSNFTPAMLDFLFAHAKP